MKVESRYLLPREKIQQKGVTSLTDTELLQVLIGSGNGQAGVGRIAKRSLRLLSRFGSSLTYDQLSGVIGLGPARTSLIVAAFELAARYPVAVSKPPVSTVDDALRLMSDIRTSKSTRLIVITVDGAKRFISKRSYQVLESTHPSGLLRRLFSDVIADNASGFYLGIGSAEYAMTPRMFDLSFARDLRVMAQLFLVTVHCHFLVNATEQYSLKQEAW